MNPKNQGCIYLLRNTANGMCYVGQSIHNPPTQRIASHLGEGYYYDEYGVKQKSLYSHGNRLIKTDVEKYGKSVFEWAILRDNIADEDLDDCEAEEIARHNTYRPNGYNLSILMDITYLEVQISMSLINTTRKSYHVLLPAQMIDFGNMIKSVKVGCFLMMIGIHGFL